MQVSKLKNLYSINVYTNNEGILSTSFAFTEKQAKKIMKEKLEVLRGKLDNFYVNIDKIR